MVRRPSARRIRLNETQSAKMYPVSSGEWSPGFESSNVSSEKTGSYSDQEGVVVVEPFRIQVTDEMLNDLRARLRQTRWPDQVPGIDWKQGTELEWLKRLVSYWVHEFDWRAWERRLNALDHFTWEGIHFVRQRATAGRGIPLILTHGWPSSFLEIGRAHV